MTAAVAPLSPAATVAAGTLVLLALGEHFVQLAAGISAYGVAWWLLREPVRAAAPPAFAPPPQPRRAGPSPG